MHRSLVFLFATVGLVSQLVIATPLFSTPPKRDSRIDTSWATETFGCDDVSGSVVPVCCDYDGITFNADSGRFTPGVCLSNGKGDLTENCSRYNGGASVLFTGLCCPIYVPGTDAQSQGCVQPRKKSTALVEGPAAWSPSDSNSQKLGLMFDS